MIWMIRGTSSQETGWPSRRSRCRVDLTALSKTYGDFYAPAFAIRAGADDLLRDALIGITQVEASLVLGAAGRVSFTVVDSYSIEYHTFKSGRNEDLLDLLAFGTQIDICMGYGDARTMRPMISGQITEVTTNFPETGTPELTISGYDAAF